MATSQAMANPSDWLSQPFQTGLFNTTQTGTPPITVAADSRNNHLSPDQGRVAKPLRRRSRASRRTPTTLFNTDTANFRAMVQRFTGGPAAGYRDPAGGGRGLGFMEHIADIRPASGFDHMEYLNQGLQQQQQQQMMFMMGGGGGGTAAAPPRSGSANENLSYDNYMV